MISIFVHFFSLWGCTRSDTCDTAEAVPEGLGRIDAQCQCRPPSIEVGTGESTFEAIASGGDMPMVHGPQGGWHLLTAVQLHNVRSVVELEAQAFIEGVPITGLQRYHVPLTSVAPCTAVLTDLYLYLSVTEWADDTADTPPALFSCKDTDVDVCASDSDGRRVCERLSARILPDPMDVKAGLAEACGDVTDTDSP